MGLDSSQLTDEEISRLVQAGNIEIFGEIVRRYEDKIKRYGRKFLRELEDIEDIIQDVFIKAYENIKSFDPKRKFSSWFYRIAHNEFVNAIKKKSKTPLSFFAPDTLFPHPISKENSDKESNGEELQQMINKCLDKIGPKYREPIILYYFEELGYKEIAEVLHIPISTVGIRLKRGKDKIKNIYNKREHKFYE